MTIPKTELERMTRAEQFELTVDAIAGDDGKIIHERIMKAIYDQPLYRYTLDRIYMSHDYFIALMNHLHEANPWFFCGHDGQKGTFMGIPYFLVKDENHLFFAKTYHNKQNKLKNFKKI